MQKNFFILLIFACFGCKQNSQVENVAKHFKVQNTSDTLVANIDFSLTEATLINSIEKQLNIDLCETLTFTAKMQYEDIDIEFPAAAFKKCEILTTGYRNLIPILVNAKNEVLIFKDVINKNTSIENKILDVTKEMTYNNSRKSLIYLFLWDKKLAANLSKQRLFEILLAIKNYRNQLALKKYGKDISNLTEQEQNQIKDELAILIAFSDELPTPPTPPMDLNSN